MSALPPFHKALYDRLSGDAGLLAYQNPSMPEQGVGTFDSVPSGETYPYLVFESHTEVTAGARTFGGQGYGLTAQVGIWDDYAGSVRGLEIAGLMDAALTEPLNVEGWGLVYVELELRTTVKDGSGLRRVVNRFGGDAHR